MDDLDPETNSTAYSTYTDADLKTMSYLEYDMINYVYDMPPVANNSFYVAKFGETISNPTTDKYAFDNAMYRVHAINFNLPTIDYEEHPQLNMEFIKSVKYCKTVSFLWLDDAYRSVQKYHLDWMSNFYNRRGDYLVNGARGKFRNCMVILFHTKQKTPGMGLYETTPVVEPILKLEFRGMQVKGAGGLDLKFGGPQSDTLLKIDYSIISCNMKYNAAFSIADSDKNMIAANAKAGNVLWAPLTEMDNGTTSPEILRMSQSLTQLLNGEGLIG